MNKPMSTRCSIAHILSTADVAVLATEHGGQPHTSLIAITPMAECRRLVFATYRNTQKYTNLTHNRKVSVLIDGRASCAAQDGFVLTAVGQVRDISADAYVSTLQAHLHKHPDLTAFTQAPDCVLLEVVVEAYQIVRGIDDVCWWRVTDLEEEEKGEGIEEGKEKDDITPAALSLQALEELSQRTVAHYNQNADDFFECTRDHDVRQNMDALLSHINTPAPFTLLDFGCGPGRDLKAFSALGHKAIGLEGAARFADMARAYSGCEVWLQDFLALDLPGNHFDGVFANASLFHVPSVALPAVLAQLHTTLKPQGVLFSSNPRGQNDEGFSGERYGAYHDLANWRRYMAAAGFTELTHYYRPPGLPIEQQPWLASVWRKL